MSISPMNVTPAPCPVGLTLMRTVSTLGGGSKDNDLLAVYEDVHACMHHTNVSTYIHANAAKRALPVLAGLPSM